MHSALIKPRLSYTGVPHVSKTKKAGVEFLEKYAGINLLREFSEEVERRTSNYGSRLYQCGHLQLRSPCDRRNQKS